VARNFHGKVAVRPVLRSAKPDVRLGGIANRHYAYPFSMVDDEQPSTTPARGDRRGKDRRKDDRRRDDRRLPVPWWRRPWALVLYGVLGALLVVLFFNRSRPPQVPAGGGEEITTAAPGAPVGPRPAPAAPDAPAEDARRPADYQRLMAEGEDAKGRWVYVELYCGSISQVALRNVDRIESAVVELADNTNRVPAAECKWGPHNGAEPRADVILLVPPGLAENFANARTVDDGFVRRRRIEGVAEWVGRSDALALRTALTLREFPPAAAR
jgi:hypothetical protein